MPREAFQDTPSGLRQLGLDPLEPQAEPVSTYVKPALDTSAGSNLLQLASSMQGLSGSLDSLAAKQQGDDKAAQQANGEFAAYVGGDNPQGTQGGFADGIAKGLLPFQSSGYNVKSYQEGQGQVLGGDLKMKYQTAWDQWDGKDYVGPDAPQKFQAWKQEFFQNNLPQNLDPYTKRGLLPALQQITAAADGQFTKQQHDLYLNGTITQAATSIQQDADLGHAANAGVQSPASYDQLFATMQEKRAALLKTGITADQADQMLNTAAVQVATKYKDPGYLAWGQQTVPGTDHTYAQADPDTFDKAAKSVDSLQRQSLATSREQFAAQQKQAREEVTSDTIGFLAANPGQPIPQALMDKAKANGFGDFGVKAVEWQHTLADGFKADKTTLGNLYADLTANPAQAMGKVSDAIANKTLTDPGDITAAYSFAKGLRDNGDRVTAALGSPTVSTIEGAINTRTQKSDNPNTPFNPGNWSDNGLAARAQLRQYVVGYIQANPNATPAEIDNYANTAGAAILKNIGDAGPLGGGQYQPIQPPAGQRLDAFSTGLQAQREQRVVDPKTGAGLAPQAATGSVPANGGGWWSRGLAAATEAVVGPADQGTATAPAGTPQPAAPSAAPTVQKVDAQGRALNPDGSPTSANVRPDGTVAPPPTGAKGSTVRDLTSPEEFKAMGAWQSDLSPADRKAVMGAVAAITKANPNISPAQAVVSVYRKLNPAGAAPGATPTPPATPGPQSSLEDGTVQPASLEAPASGTRTLPPVSSINWDKGGADNDTKAAVLVNHAVGIGLRPEIAAAIIGHADAESNFRTKAFNPTGEASHGLFQWNEDAGRWKPFLNWAQQNGRNAEDPIAQLDYAKVEASRMRGPDPHKSLWQSVQDAPNMASASKMWMDYFEQPKVRDYGNRLGLGEKALAAYQGHGGAQPESSYVTPGAAPSAPGATPEAPTPVVVHRPGDTSPARQSDVTPNLFTVQPAREAEAQAAPEERGAPVITVGRRGEVTVAGADGQPQEATPASIEAAIRAGARRLRVEGDDQNPAQAAAIRAVVGSLRERFPGLNFVGLGSDTDRHGVTSA